MEEKVTLSAKEAAKYIGCSYWLFRQLIKCGNIPHIRYGMKIVCRKSVLDKWLEQQEKKYAH